MPCTLKLLFLLVIRSVRSRHDLLLENLALRQQLAVLERRYPQPRLSNSDRFFWVALRRLWPGWRKALVLVQPDTVIRWHRTGFDLYWKWRSRKHAVVGQSDGSFCGAQHLRWSIARSTSRPAQCPLPPAGATLLIAKIDNQARQPLIHLQHKTWTGST